MSIYEITKDEDLPARVYLVYGAANAVQAINAAATIRGSEATAECLADGMYRVKVWPPNAVPDIRPVPGAG